MSASSTFQELLNILLDDAQPFPLYRLSELSDLDREQIEGFQAIWPRLSAERKRTLIAELGDLADRHFEMLFEPINLLAVSDPDAEVRRLAIENLWECERPDLAVRLIEAVRRDPAEGVRAAAAAALGRFVYLGELEDLAPDLWHQAEDVLLLAAREDPNPEVRLRSLEALGFSSRSEVVELLEEAYRSPEEHVRRAALLAMGRSADARWRKHVVAELHSPSPGLREEAVRAAGELELRETVPLLIDLLADVSDAVRQAAIWALGQLGGEEAAEALYQLFEETEDPEELDLIEDALDHLAFVDQTRDLLLFDLEEPEEPNS